jgi:hypothetical protein
MNNTTILKSLSELQWVPMHDVAVPRARNPETPTRPEDPKGESFREMLDHRYNAPYPYPQWGLNE